MKKAQITMFVILGLLIVIVVGSAFYFLNKGKGDIGVTESAKAELLTEEAQDVHTSLQTCLGDVARDGIRLLAIQGGYTDTSGVDAVEIPGITGAYASTAVLFNQGETLSLNEQKIGSELDMYIKNNAATCEDEIAGATIEYGSNIGSNTVVTNEDIKFNIDWNIKINHGQTQSRIESMVFAVPVNFKRTVGIVNNLLADQKDKSSTNLCISCVIDAGVDNDVTIDLANVEDRTIVYAITDEQSTIDNTPFGVPVHKQVLGA